MTSFKDIEKALKADGYKVNLLPQEKTAPKEIVLLMTALDYTVETPTSYVVKPTVWIGWTETDPDNIITSVATLVSKLTARISEASFVLGKTQIDILGQLYRVSITCEWKTIVTAVPPAIP